MLSSSSCHLCTSLSRWSCRLDALVVILLVLTGLKVSTGLETVLDIHQCDELSYTLAGALLPKVDLCSSWAPFYSIWHAILLSFSPDRTNEFYLNYHILNVLTPTLFYIALRTYSVSPLLAVSLSWFFLTSTTNLTECPKVNSFGLAVIFVCLIVAGRLRCEERVFSFLSAASVVVSFIRPEFFYVSLLMWGGFWVYKLVLVARRQKTRAFLPLAYFGFSLSLIFAFGNPLSDPSYNRDLEAFGCGYASSWATWAGEDAKRFNVFAEWRPIFEKEFGQAKSWYEALLANPSTFAKHVRTNLSKGPKVLHSALLTDYFHRQTIGSSFPSRIAISVIILLLSISFSSLKLTTIVENARRRIALVTFLLAGCVVSSAPLFLTLLYGRHLYTLIALIVVLLTTLTALPHSLAFRQKVSYLSVIPISLLLLVVTPPINSDSQAVPMPTTALIRYVQEIPLEKEPTILAYPRFVVRFFGSRFRVASITLDEVTGGIGDDNSPSLIIFATDDGMSPSELENKRKLQEDAPRYGYIEIPWPEGSGQIFLRRDLARTTMLFP